MSDQFEFAAALGFSGSCNQSGITPRRAAFYRRRGESIRRHWLNNPQKVRAVADKNSRKSLGGRDWRDIVKQIEAYAVAGWVSREIAGLLDISTSSVLNFVRRSKDDWLLSVMMDNSRLRKIRAGQSQKGITKSTKGKTYEEIFGNKEKAARRSAVTSAWMKTHKNIRRYAKRVSKPQLKLFKEVKEVYPDAVLEYPYKVEGVKTIWLDIAVVSQKINFEYDGEYWHKLNNQNNNLKDDMRDSILQAAGWTVIRIKEGQKYDIKTCRKSV